MKTLKNLMILCLLSASIFWVSCEEYTEVDLPKSQLTGVTVYKNLSTAKAALSDIYARIRNGGVLAGTQFGCTTLMANYVDDMDYYGQNSEMEEFSNHTVQSSNYFLAVIWDNTYSQIYALNSFLQGIDNSQTIAEEDKKQLIGDALFLRAFLNFYLVNLFGDVPYMTSIDPSINAILGRTTVSQMYSNITNDLLEAEELVTDSYVSTERVHPNKAAVRALLARVYLYTGNYNQAEAMTTALITDPTYSLDSNLSNSFLKESPAIILAAHSGMPGQNTEDAVSFLLWFGPPFKPSLSEQLYNSFETGDMRKTKWIGTLSVGNSSWHYPAKYKLDEPSSPSAEYTIWLGLSEQYLIRAEARAMMGNILGGLEDLNVIRTRAGLTESTAATTSALTAAILRERRFELFTEQSHRWFDLKRTGNAAEALSGLKIGWRNTDLLLPIPEKELQLNKNLSPQNPGY